MKEAELLIDEKLFDKGAFNDVYKAYDRVRDLHVVVKIHQDQNKESEDEDGKVEATDKFFQQIYAYQMSKYYRQFTQNHEEMPPIVYIMPMIYKVQKPFKNRTYLYAETLVEGQQEFLKYTNNGGYITPYELSETIAPFTHFSFAMSGSYLMITDL